MAKESHQAAQHSSGELIWIVNGKRFYLALLRVETFQPKAIWLWDTRQNAWTTTGLTVNRKPSDLSVSDTHATSNATLVTLSQRFSFHLSPHPVRKEISFFHPLHHLMYCFLYYQGSSHLKKSLLAPPGGASTSNWEPLLYRYTLCCILTS